MTHSTQQSGGFFVIDGNDGSGKATQTRLLVERLRNEGYRVETISFPQYDKPSSSMARAYLAGDYGSPEEVGPYRASVFFAIDRYDGSAQIREWLDQGAIVIADRYVSSNMGHQAATIDDADERQRYLNWNATFEYEVFQLPKPTQTFILHVPPEVSLELAKQGAAEKTKVEGDILETSIDHLKRAAETYVSIAKTFDGFVSIDCEDNGTLKSREAIHELLWQHLLPHLPEPKTSTL